MEEECQQKIHQNWDYLTDELQTKWKQTVTFLLQNKVLTLDEHDYISTISSDRDKVDYILKTVVRLTKCELFLTCLDECGCGKISRDVRDTDVGRATIDRGHTYIVNTLSRDMQRVFEGNFQELKHQFKQDFVEMKHYFQDREDRILEEVRQQALQQATSPEEELKTALAASERKYVALQNCYKSAREKIDMLTARLRQKTLENSNLSRQVSELNEEFSSLREQVKEGQALIEEQMNKYKHDVHHHEATVQRNSGEIRYLHDNVNSLKVALEEKEDNLRRAQAEMLRYEEKIAELEKRLEGTPKTKQSERYTVMQKETGHKLRENLKKKK